MASKFKKISHHFRYFGLLFLILIACSLLFLYVKNLHSTKSQSASRNTTLKKIVISDNPKQAFEYLEKRLNAYTKLRMIAMIVLMR